MAVELILDASAALAWLIARQDPDELRLAHETLVCLQTHDAVVPALWFSEVTNGVLGAERRSAIDAAKSAVFMAALERLTVVEDPVRPFAVQASVLSLARRYGLTAHDATYPELVLRTSSPLATFDRKLADATRKAGGQVFGDPS